MLRRFRKDIENDTTGNETRYADKQGSDKLNAFKSNDLLGYGIETIRDDINTTRFTPANARSSISLAAPLGDGHLTGEILYGYKKIQSICPTSAIAVTSGKEFDQRITLDKGKCILCGRCQENYPQLVRIDNKLATPVFERQQLLTTIPVLHAEANANDEFNSIGSRLKEKIASVLGRSLAIREIDAGSCNGCEVEITALTNPIYDVERFGIHFVASPRHADALMVTGPATRNMEIALKRTYEATPDPKIVIAVGACACSGGIFGNTYATAGGISSIVPVDVFIPGCPPRPEALLYGLLMAMDRIRPL